MLIIDGHLDLAYDGLINGRNLLQPLQELREQEKKRRHPVIASFTLPALKEAAVGVVFGTIFTTPADRGNVHISPNFLYHDQAQAHKAGMAQLDYYHWLADEDETIRLIGSQAELAAVLDSHDKGERPFLGIVPLMKGADPIREPEELEMWVERGVRIIAPAWDDTRYASGCLRGSRFGLTKPGYQLLEIMADFGLIVDVSHLSEQASLAVLDSYPGPIIASHNNAHALVPQDHHLSDTQIRLIGERDGVIGISLFNPDLRRGHRLREPKQLVTLDHVVAQLDHICQLLGDAAHVGLGSGLTFDAADAPTGINSVTDLHLIGDALKQKGYGVGEVTAVMGQNWRRLLGKSLP